MGETGDAGDRRAMDSFPCTAELGEALLQALDNAGIGLQVISERGTVLERIYSNATAARLWGYTPEEMRSVAPMMSLEPGERERLAEMRRRTAAGEQPPQMLETTIVDRHGGLLPIEVGIARTRSGDRDFVMTFLRDVSERHRVATALRRSEERFRRLAELTPDAILVVQDDRVVYANPALVRLLGHAATAEVIGMTVGELLDPDDLRQLSERLGRVLGGEPMPLLEYHLMRRDGVRVPVEATSIAIEWEGEPAVVGYARDITVRKRMQTEMLKADRMATIGTLAAGVAHEVNNPLTYLMIHLQQLRRSLPAAVGDARAGEFARVLDAALDGAERVRLAVRDLVSFARAEDGERGPVDLRGAMERALALAMPALRGKARVTRAFAEVPRVEANEARIGQAFLNLLVNAAQAFEQADEEQNRVAIAIRDGGDAIEIEVADNGPGIPPDVLPHVCEPFFTTRRGGQGSGLGLAVTKAIVESIDGELTLDCSGRGTAARIRVPVRRSR
jgi:PAS domain S-box-containing protein